MVLHELNGYMRVEWVENEKAILDKWYSLLLTVEQFEEAVLVKGLEYSKKHAGRAWIVDMTEARGAFSPEIQEFIKDKVFPEFTKNGVKYFITAKGESAITRLSNQIYEAQLGPAGIMLLEVPSFEVAKQWLKDN